jgi:hypothetical protein
VLFFEQPVKELCSINQLKMENTRRVHEEGNKSFEGGGS